MAGLNLEFLIATIDLSAGFHAGKVLELLEKNGWLFLERTGDTSTPKQKTRKTGFLALYLNKPPKDLSKGFVFGSDQRSCDILLATNEDIGISANHFSITRNPVFTALSSSDIQTQILGDKTTRILSEKAWQILEPGTTTTVDLFLGLQFLLFSPDRGDLQPAYNRHLQQSLRLYQKTVPELANISLEDDEVTPLIMYRCASLGRREYYAIKKIQTGDLDYDAKVHTYHARCRPTRDAPSTAQEVAGVNTQQPDHFWHTQGTTNLIRDKSKGGRPGDFYVVKDFQTKPPLRCRLPEIRFLSHMNIEETVDIITGDSVFMAVVDNFPECTLHMLLQDDRLRTEEAGFVLGQIFAALEYLHDKEWTHGNLDPRSIHVMSRKNLWIKLTDVALSDYVDLGKPDGYHEVYASQDYKDPNRCPADIWSAGVVALQLLHPDSLPIFGHLVPSVWVEKLQSLVTKWSRKIGGDAPAFVRDVLRAKSKNRPTATEVLNHPWIVQTRRESPVNNPQYNPYIPLGSRNKIPEPPLCFGKQATSISSNYSSHIGFTPQTRHTSSEPSHHPNFQNSFAPSSSTGHGNFTPGPYNTGVGSSHYSSPGGPNTLSCNATNTFYHQNDNPTTRSISSDGGFQDSNDPGSQAMLSLHPNSRDSWNDFDGGHGATVSQSSHGPANPLVSHPGISTPCNGPVTPRATGTLSTQ